VVVVVAVAAAAAVVWWCACLAGEPTARVREAPTSITPITFWRHRHMGIPNGK